MEGEEALTMQEMARVGKRALEYQRYIFRRTYGVYYLVWAAAIALVGSTDPSALFGIKGEAGSGVDSGLSLVIFVLAVAATAQIFRGAMRAIRLRRALGTEGKRSRAPYFVAWIVAIFAVAAAVEVFAPADSQAALYALALPVPLVIYYMLGMAFPDGRPVEGVLALTAYAFAAGLSLVLSVLATGSWVAAWAWGVTVAVWVLAAFYALFRAPDELEALRA